MFIGPTGVAVREDEYLRQCFVQKLWTAEEWTDARFYAASTHRGTLWAGGRIHIYLLDRDSIVGEFVVAPPASYRHE